MTDNVRVEVPDEDLLILQKLELVRIEFEKRLHADIEQDENPEFRLVSDSRAKYTIDSGLGHPITLAAADWDLLGLYSCVDMGEGCIYSWSWAWAHVEPQAGTRADIFRTVVRSKLPSLSAHNSMGARDPMIISYIQAQLLSIFKYSYIHVQPNGAGQYSAFGIRNVKWEPYDAEAHRAQLYYATLANVRT